MELQNQEVPQGNEVTDFMLYITATTSRRVAKDMLFAHVADIRESFHCKGQHEYSAQQVCQYHRQHYPDGNKDGIHPFTFLLFDSDEPKARGALLVDLRNDSGYADAVRRLPSEAALGAAAVAVGSSDWQTTRQSAFTMPGENSLALAHFALYNLADGAPFAKRALSRIDRGIHDLDIYEYQDTGSMQSEEAEENEDYYNFRYEVIIPDTKDSTVEDIIGRHSGIASAKGLDENRFVILDNEYEREGVLIVQVDPKDQFRCKGAPAGELTWWIAIGFATWWDTKDFAERHSAV